MDCIWEDLQPRAAVSLTLQSVDGRLRRIGRLSQPATTRDTASFSQADQNSTTACAKPDKRCDFVDEENSEGTGLGNFECWFARPAHGFKPAADIYLGMGFAAEMPRGWAASGSQVPLNDRELLISTLDHKPMDRILTDGPANLALELLQTRHALSVERWLRKNELGKN
jgi:hypothetical protein